MTEAVWSKEHGDALRERRRRRGLTQEELAELAGVSARTIRSLEQGDREPHISTIRLVAEALGCHPDDLLDKRVQPPSAPRPVATPGGHEAVSAAEPAAEPETADAASLVVLPMVDSAGRRKRVWWVAAAAAIVIVVVAVGFWLRASRQPVVDLDAGLVAVVPFTNQTGDASLDAIGNRVADHVMQGLAESGIANAVATLTMASLDRTGDLPAGAPHDPTEVGAVAMSTGAGLVVTGAYQFEGERLQLLAQITDARRQELVYAVPMVVRPLDAVDDAIDDAGERILGALGAHYDYFLPGPGVVPPPTFKAYREFRAGMDSWREIWEGSTSTSFRHDAVPHFRRSIELDPAFLAPHVAAFTAFYTGVGDHAAADSCLQTMLRDRGRLNPAERLLLAYCITRSQGDHRGRLRAMRALVELDPHYQYGLQLVGNASVWLFRWREAIQAYSRMDPATLRDRLLGESRLQAQSTAYHMLGEHEQALATAELFRDLYPDEPHHFRAYIGALVGLGRVEDVHQAIDECETLSQLVFDPGRMMGIAVSELRWHDYPAAADTIADRAVAYYLSRPEHEREAVWYRWGLARAMYRAGRWDEAQQLAEELAVDLPDDIDVTGLLGVIAARRGDRELAIKIIDGLRNVDRPHMWGNHIDWCARIAAVLGERERAVELLREAMGQGLTIFLHTAVEYEVLRGYPPFEELVRPEG